PIEEGDARVAGGQEVPVWRYLASLRPPRRLVSWAPGSRSCHSLHTTLAATRENLHKHSPRSAAVGRLFSQPMQRPRRDLREASAHEDLAGVQAECSGCDSARPHNPTFAVAMGRPSDRMMRYQQRYFIYQAGVAVNDIANSTIYLVRHGETNR